MGTCKLVILVFAKINLFREGFNFLSLLIKQYSNFQ